MYNATTIKTAFDGLIGWKQNIDPSGVQLTDLTSSSSGLWFNGVHPMLTIDNLISIAPEFEVIDPDPTAVNIAFTAWLKEKTEDGMIKAVEAWKDEKAELDTAVALLERTDLFAVYGNAEELTASTAKIVGIEIRPSMSKSLIVKTMQIGLQFDTNQTITIRLFKAGTNAEIASQSVVYTGNGGVQWQTVDWNLEGEGLYYIGYDQNLVSGSAVNGIYSQAYGTKGMSFFPSGRYYKAVAFEADVADMSTLWNTALNQYTVATNHGLNLKLSSGCEYTALIVEQKDLFKSLVMLQVGIDLLHEMITNPNSRVNRNQAGMNAKSLSYDVYGDTQGRNSHTVAGRYEKALKAIQFDGSGLDKICLPCLKKSVRYKSIGAG